MSDLVVTVRQIANYPNIGASNGSETLLLQQGGLGAPYVSISTANLVRTALNQSNLGVGFQVPGDAAAGQIFAGPYTLPAGYSLLWNNYWDGSANINWFGGLAARLGFDVANMGWAFELAPVTQPGQPCDFVQMMSLSTAGALSLPFGTLTVARDPAAAKEVATMGWVSNNTVASFNNRKGQVTLTPTDIYNTLCLNSPIATEQWVQDAIQAGIQNMLWTCPLVNKWNGRTGQVFLTLADITCTFFQPGQQPISPTPPLTSNDNSIATTQWVTEFILQELEGGGSSLASQSWVLANTVNSFNGRQGPVTLTSADVFDVGAAALVSPNFSGIPTAPTAAQGQATGQIATTAFVQQAIAHNTAGVSTFNTRAGDVVLTTNDVTTAGGLTNPSPNLTGAPTAPTAAPGTSTPQIANTQFVMTALAGTVQSFNGRTGAVSLLLSDITGVGGAPAASPALTGTPTAPTAPPGTDTTQIATTAFVTDAFTLAGGVSSFNARTGAVTLQANDISAAGGLINPSVGLTGTPTAPTAAPGTNTAQLATCAFVAAAVSSSVSSFNTRTGAIVLTSADLTGAGGALLAGPNFTGAPTAPTATAGTATTQLATTQFVAQAIAANPGGVTSFNTRTGAVVLSTADITTAGGAPIASPSFTGTPLAPTAAPGSSTTQIATTAFVQAAVGSGGVTSFNARTGAVTFQANDISAVGGALLAGPNFTGTPTAPTAAPGTNTTQLASTAYVVAALAAVSGITVGTTAPTAPQAGRGWFNMADAQLYVWTGAQWVIAVNPPMPDLSGYAALNGATFTGPVTHSGGALLTLTGANVPQLSIVGSGAANSLAGVRMQNPGAPIAAGGLWEVVIGTGGSFNVSMNTAAAGDFSTQTWPLQIFEAAGTTQVLALGTTAAAGSNLTGAGTPVAFGWDTTSFPGYGLISLQANLAATTNSWLVRGLNSGPPTFALGGVLLGAVASGQTISLGLSNNTVMTWSATPSDPRLKQNQAAPDKDALAIVESVPVWQADYHHPQMPAADEHWDFTVMADAVKEQLPYAYMDAPENGYASLHPLHLITTLWRAVQQLAQRVATLEATDASLRAAL